MFRFTIRELVLLTLVVAMGVGWWLTHQQARSLDDQCRTLRQEYALVCDRLNKCNAYLNKLDPNRDDYDQF
jgi:lipopolysaccharide biosynthesis regulator YciM